MARRNAFQWHRQEAAFMGLTTAPAGSRNFTGEAVFHRHTAFVVKAEGQTEITHLYTGRMR